MLAVPRIVRDLILLLGRLGLGFVLVAHGWQKFTGEGGVSGVAAGFSEMGIPVPTVSAWYAALVELVGGAALIVGAFLPVVAVLVALDMAGAFFLVHVSNGVFVDQGGFELVLVIAVAALAIGFSGGGRIGLDGLLFSDRSDKSDQRSGAETPA